MKSRSQPDYVISHAFQLKQILLIKSVKTLVCVLVVSDVLLATGILTQTKRYPVSMLTIWLRLIVLVARIQKYIAQHGSPRYLNIMSTFIRDLFALFTSLNKCIHLKWLLIILSNVSR